MTRWKAIVSYRTENGIVDVEYLLQEIVELQDIIERGPDWNALHNIKITRFENPYPDLTIEQSLKF